MDTSLWFVVAPAMLTAIMTGVGALPFLFVKKIGDRRADGIGIIEIVALQVAEGDQSAL